MMLLWWIVMWGIHNLVFERSTTGWGCQSHLFLYFFVSMNDIISNDGIA
jgi:hypothetical protein